MCSQAGMAVAPLSSHNHSHCCSPMLPHHMHTLISPPSGAVCHSLLTCIKGGCHFCSPQHLNPSNACSLGLSERVVRVLVVCLLGCLFGWLLGEGCHVVCAAVCCHQLRTLCAVMLAAVGLLTAASIEKDDWLRRAIALFLFEGDQLRVDTAGHWQYSQSFCATECAVGAACNDMQAVQ